MTPDEVRRLFDETEALLQGHFRLSSGLHSSRYLQCAKVLQWPEKAEALGRELGARLTPFEVGAVVSPALGGLIIGHETGRALKVRALFAERVEKAFTLRRGFSLAAGERVAVVEDVVTTGQSTREVLGVVRAHRALPVVCGAIVDRRPGAGGDSYGGVDEVPFRALLTLDVPAWEPGACPLCRSGTPLEVPGSRHLVSRG